MEGNDRSNLLINGETLKIRICQFDRSLLSSYKKSPEHPRTIGIGIRRMSRICKATRVTTFTHIESRNAGAPPSGGVGKPRFRLRQQETLWDKDRKPAERDRA